MSTSKQTAHVRETAGRNVSNENSSDDGMMHRTRNTTVLTRQLTLFDATFHTAND